MRKIILAITVMLTIVSVAALGYAGIVDVITLEDDTINPITAEYIITAIERAEKNRSPCLIIRLDTPGGLLNSTRKIVKAIMISDVPIVVYIAPGGSRAGSAGVFITYAAHIAAMAPSTNIGAAHPVQMGQRQERTNVWDAVKEFIRRTDQQKDAPRTEEKHREEIAQDQDDPMRSKILNDTVAFIKSIAEKRGRNVEWAIQSVVQSDSITEQDALQKGVIDLVASDDQDLLKQLDGRMVIVNGQERILDTKNASPRSVEMTARQKLFNILANPNVAYILMILGFYGLLYEITNPGIGVPGIAGTIFLILAFFSMQALPTNYAGLALIVLGLVLFVAEAMVPGFGLLTLGGLVSLILGSMLLFDSVTPVMRVSFSIIIPFAFTTAAITIFLVKAVFCTHRKKAASGKEGLIGSCGVARGNIKQGETGTILVHGEIWNAVAQDEILKGEKVIVSKIEGLLLTVKKQQQ